MGKVAIVCAGLHSDRLALKSEKNLPLRILPFRGEYYKFTSSAPKLINHLVYPVPDPNFPFLGVHFTRMIQGGIECGPNAVFAFGREAYKKTDFNLRDLYEAFAWKGFRVIAKKYWRNGSIYIFRPVNILVDRKLIKDPIVGFEMPWKRSINIDSYADLETARLLARQNLREIYG